MAKQVQWRAFRQHPNRHLPEGSSRIRWTRRQPENPSAKMDRRKTRTELPVSSSVERDCNAVSSSVRGGFVNSPNAEKGRCFGKRYPRGESVGESAEISLQEVPDCGSEPLVHQSIKPH